MVQWLRLSASTARDVGLISGQGTKIPKPRNMWPKKKKKNIYQKINNPKQTYKEKLLAKNF